MDNFLLGAIVACAAFIGLFFLKFYRGSRDRFFLMFALAFWLEGLGRIQEGVLDTPADGASAVYLVRVAAYVLILAAIVDKNLRRDRSS